MLAMDIVKYKIKIQYSIPALHTVSILTKKREAR
jgi:hypothetical protein